MICGHNSDETSASTVALPPATSGAIDHDFEESCQAIAESLAGDPKQDILFEDYRAQFEAEREARRRAHEADALTLM